MLSASEARRVLEYNPHTGTLFWKVRPSNNVCVGGVAGWCAPEDYPQVRIHGVLYKSHRVIWLIQTGVWPICEVDHINGNRSDNRWYNLREATRTINGRNQKLRSTSKTGIMGVSWYPRYNAWQVRIGDGSTYGKYLGRHKDFFEACCVRKSAENALHDYHTNHGRTV